jgi:hypothetical protein
MDYALVVNQNDDSPLVGGQQSGGVRNFGAGSPCESQKGISS